MKRLEGVRLEVDSRRHTVAALGAKIEGQRARLPQTRSKGEFQMEQTIRKMQHKENKLARPPIRPASTPQHAEWRRVAPTCAQSELRGRGLCAACAEWWERFTWGGRSTSAASRATGAGAARR